MTECFVPRSQQSGQFREMGRTVGEPASPQSLKDDSYCEAVSPRSCCTSFLDELEEDKCRSKIEMVQPISTSCNLEIAIKQYQSECLKARNGESSDREYLFQQASQIGRCLQKLGRLEEAMEYYGQALHLKNQKLDSEPNITKAAVADILFNIGVIHMSSISDARDKCIEAFGISLDLRRYCFGSVSPSVASVLYKLATIHFSMGEEDYAMELLLETISILNSIEGDHHKALAEVWNSLCMVQQSLGQFEEAESSYKEVLSLLKR